MTRRAEPSPTLVGWLRQATERLAAAGVDSPRPDAERLASHALGIGWSDLWSRLRDPLDPETTERLDALVGRRAHREPLAYILGSAGFYGLELDCGPGVLVPRPETESLVDVVLEFLPAGPVRVVDIGTGTGAVALAVAHQRPDAEVWATERAAGAITYARRNIARTSDAVRLCAGDLFAPLPPQLRGGFDAVVSNPPYVPAGREDLIAPEVGAEPPEALFAGDGGDAVLSRLVAEAPGWLDDDGVLAVEVGTPEQADRIASALDDWDASGIRPDQSGRPRVVWGRCPPR